MIKGEVIGSNPGQPSSRKLEVNVQGKILKSLPFSNGFKCRHSLKNSEEKNNSEIHFVFVLNLHRINRSFKEF